MNRLSDGPTIRLLKFFIWLGLELVLSVAWLQGFQLVGFFLLRYFSGFVWHTRDLQVSQYVVSVGSSSPMHHRSHP